MLWLALAPEKFPLQADTFGSAAGTAGKQKWSLILPSSARVSELTYVTIVGTRYPELDTFQNDIIQFGNYLQGEQSTRGGGFCPFFGMHSYIHASTDIWRGGGLCLALSNQQACVRPCCFTGRPRPLGTGFFNGSMVLSFDLLLPPIRFLPYGFLATGSPRLTAF